MEYKRYLNLKEFYNDTYDILKESEVQNLIILGNLIIGNKEEDLFSWKNPANWFMATIKENNQVILTALMTPPYNITLYATANKIKREAITLLVESIIQEDINIPGVLSTVELATTFSDLYCKQKSKTPSIVYNQMIYQLTEVNQQVKEKGRIRLALPTDQSIIEKWIGSFNKEALNHSIEKKNLKEETLNQINSKKVYVLEVDEKIVSMAKITRELINTAGIGYVYTPDESRKKGYASSLVKKLSKKVLKQGYLGCALYTDASNPTSNSIYQRIGYNKICDSIMIEFIYR